jgi:hypothetical protein
MEKITKGLLGATIYAADKVPSIDDKTYTNEAKPPFIRFLNEKV